MSIAGIYVIKCLPAGTVYVGSTNNLKRRQYEHLYKLRIGRHPNHYLQYAFDKYGENSFVFLSKRYSELGQADLRTREGVILERYRKKCRVFNLVPIEKGRLWGWKLTEMQRQKISKRLKGVPRSPAVKERCRLSKAETFKGVVGVSTVSNSVLTFISTRDAEKAGFSRKEIRQCCNGQARTHRGYLWRWL